MARGIKEYGRGPGEQGDRPGLKFQWPNTLDTPRPESYNPTTNHRLRLVFYSIRPMKGEDSHVP